MEVTPTTKYMHVICKTLFCGDGYADMWRLAKAMAWLPTQVCSQHLLRSEIILILPRNPHQLHIFLAYSIRFSTCLDPSVMLGFGMMI